MDLPPPPSTPNAEDVKKSVLLRIGQFLVGFCGGYLVLFIIVSFELSGIPSIVVSGLLVIGSMIYYRKRSRWIARGIAAAVLLPVFLALLIFGMCTIGPWKMGF